LSPAAIAGAWANHNPHLSEGFTKGRVSTPLKNLSQIGNLPQVGVKIKIFETTTYTNHVLSLAIFFCLQNSGEEKRTSSGCNCKIMEVASSNPFLS